MPQWAATRDAFSGSLQSRRLWLIQFLGNPILFLSFVGWLRIPEGNAWQLILSVLLAAAIVAGVLILHGGTLVYFYDRFQSEGAPLKPAFGRAVRNVAAIAVWACVFWVFWLLAAKLDYFHDQVPTYLRSVLPAFLRRILTLAFVTRLFDAALFFIRWIVVPGLLLPFAASAARLGFRGFGRQGFATWRLVVKSSQYWGIVAIAAVFGVWMSGAIVGWTPRSLNPTFTGETISLVLRLFLAYLLGLFAWLLTCSMIGRRCGGPEHASWNISV